MLYTLISLKEETTDQKWKDLIREQLSSAKSFEIHCWADESVWIELALRYGQLKETDWAYGKVVTGEVTPDFAAMILGLPKPPGNEMENNRMTPFFSIFLDNGFSSSHYGAEVYLP